MILKTTLQANEQREVAVRGDFIVCVSAKQGTKEVELIFSFEDTKEVELKQGATYKADDIFKRFLIKNPYPDAEVEINVIVVLKGQITYPANIEAAITDSGLATEFTLRELAKESTLKNGQFFNYLGVDVPYLHRVIGALGSSLAPDDQEGFLRDIQTQGGPVNASHLSSIVQNQTLMLGELLAIKAETTALKNLLTINDGVYSKSGNAFNLLGTEGNTVITISEPNMKRIVFSVSVGANSQVIEGETYGGSLLTNINRNNSTDIELTIRSTFSQSDPIIENSVNSSRDYTIIRNDDDDALNSIRFVIYTRQIKVPTNKSIAYIVSYKIYK